MQRNFENEARVDVKIDEASQDDNSQPIALVYSAPPSPSSLCSKSYVKRDSRMDYR